jgi:hypothetical protein
VAFIYGGSNGLRIKEQSIGSCPESFDVDGIFPESRQFDRWEFHIRLCVYILQTDGAYNAAHEGHQQASE